MTPATAPAEVLRRVPLFEGLGEDDLAHLAGRARPVELEAGTVLVAEGEAADAMYVVADGLLEASKLEGDRSVRLGVYGPGEPLGELALLARRRRSATVRALRDSRLLCIDEASFAELVGMPSVALHMLHTILGRLESQEARLRQHAKMAALGTQAAGLLHDLNNPAAAVRSSIRRLREVLADWRGLAVELARAAPPVAAAVDALRADAGQAPPSGSLERSDREEELLSWLQAHGLRDAWKLAPALADQGLASEALERCAGELRRSELELVVAWLALDGEIERLLDDSARAAEHISEVARRSKSYSRLDQAPIGDVDVHDGLETALTLARYKLGSVRVRREFAPDLPRVEGYPADLNEVWLNLVDNALDALDGDGELALRTSTTGDGGVAVEVADSGPGVAEDVRERVFDPFFTTKPVGAGSGLGLAQVYRIVVEEHGGTVELESEPGRTVFRVALPLRLPAGFGDRAAAPQPAPGA